MDIDPRFLTAAAFRFEAARGVRHSSFETEFIADAKLTTVPPEDLAHTLWHWLATEGADSPLRSSAYWALGKRRDPSDVVPLVAALRRELPRDADVAYQILIALEDLGEPVFPLEQRERSSRDHELNRAAAQRYLGNRPLAPRPPKNVSLARHQSFLERSALREAQKAFRDRSRTEVKIEEYLALRVQTVEWWKRLLAILLGLGAMGFAGWSLATEFNIWITLVFGIAGLGVFLAGLIGWKESVEGVLDASADALFNRLLDALF